jgi:predicted permease
MNHVTQDIRIALRGLRRAPAFAIAVVLSLALGIGANATMFTILDPVLLRPLPYTRADELVAPSLGGTGIVPDSYFLKWAASTRTLAFVAEYNALSMVVGAAGPPEELTGAIASPDFVRVLGVAPAIGRFITAGDALAGALPVAVLGHEFWQRQFAGDSHVLGRTITVNGTQTTVVGVMPAGFSFPPRASLWLPRPPIDTRPGAGFRIGLVVGRRRPGMSIEQVQRELAQVPRPADLQRSWSLRDSAVVVTPLHDQLYGTAKPMVVLLFAAVTLLLLIACANVANLVLARTTRRRQEFSIRSALGASRATLYWEVVVECLLLALGGGALGVLISIWLSQLFTRLMPESISMVARIGVDGRVLVFTFGISVLAAFLISSGPALRAAGGAAHALLADGGVRAGDSRLARFMRRSLVVVQLSTAVVLLTGAGLLVKSLARLTSQDNGFRPDHLLIVTVNLPTSRYKGAVRANQFFDALAARFAALPGAQRVAQGPPPLVGYGFMYLQAATPETPSYKIAVSDVGPGFFETYRIPVLAGRSILSSDDSTAPPVVVVNATAARLIAPGGNAIGQQLGVITIRRQHSTVVGIVADVPQRDIAVRPLPEAFSATAQDLHSPSWLAIRVAGDPGALALPVQKAVRDLDPELVVRAESMESMLSKSLVPHRFTAVVLGMFALLAMTLAAVGLFGVIAYLVERRTREIGVRMALGAQRRHVVGLVLREGLTLTAVGVSVGIAFSIGLAHLLQSLLYEVQPTDAGVIVAVTSALSGVALLATALPAMRATRVDPMITLRAE